MKNFQISAARASLVLGTFALLTSSCATKPSADFMAADVNASKTLDQSEINHFVARQFMTNYDANKDGGVTFAEWQQMRPEADKKTFAKRDKNSDGKVDAEEMLSVVAANPTFGRLLETMDTNKDGAVQPAEGANFRKHMDEM